MKNFQINIKYLKKSIGYVIIPIVIFVGIIFLYTKTNFKKLELGDVKGFDMKYDLYYIFDEINENSKIDYNVDTSEIIIKSNKINAVSLSNEEVLLLSDLGWKKIKESECFYKYSQSLNEKISLCLLNKEGYRLYKIK